MSFCAPRRICFDGNEGMFRPGLHPPWPAVRINNDLLIWSSVSDPSRDSVDSFSSALRRRRNMGELDGWAGAAFLRMASLTRNVETQSACNEDKCSCNLLRRNACNASRGASSRVVPCEHVRPRDLKSDKRAGQGGERSSGYECQSVSCRTAGRLQTMRLARASPGLHRAP